MTLPTLPARVVAPSGRRHRCGPDRYRRDRVLGPGPSWPRARRLISLRVAPALVFSYLGLAQLAGIRVQAAQALAGHRLAGALPSLALSSLYVIFVGLSAVLVLRRPPALVRDASVVAWALAMAATFGLFIAPRLPAGPALFSPGTPLQLGAVGVIAASLGFSCAALWRLGRSFSLTPEARALVTAGPYRLVRHPLYLSESVTLVAYGLASGRLTFLMVVIAILAIQVLRSRLEERILGNAFPEYQLRFEGVPHLIPWVY